MSRYSSCLSRGERALSRHLCSDIIVSRGSRRAYEELSPGTQKLAPLHITANLGASVKTVYKQTNKRTEANFARATYQGRYVKPKKGIPVYLGPCGSVTVAEANARGKTNRCGSLLFRRPSTNKKSPSPRTSGTNIRREGTRVGPFRPDEGGAIIRIEETSGTS